MERNFIRFDTIKLFYKLKTIKMKKKGLLIAALFTAGLSFAQDGLTSKKGVPILPEAGDWSIGFDASSLLNYGGGLLNGSTGASLGNLDLMNNTISAKKFVDANKAYRAMANIGFGSNTSFADGDSTEIKTSGFDFAVGGGIETRRGKGRLQGVYGPMAMIAIGSSSTTSTTGSNTIEVKPGMSLGLTVGAFAGVEYFFAPKISLGAEVSWGVNFTSVGESETTVTGSDTVKREGTSSFNIGTTPNSMISLNFHF